MGMMNRLLGEVAALGRAVVSRPLERAELVEAAALLVVAGTAYCAAYCRIAFYPMHAGGMPLWLSAWWATTSLLPWLAAFEAVKRLLPRIGGIAMKIAAFVAIAGGAAGLTALAYWLGDIEIMKVSATHWQMLVASQLQPTVVFALLVAVWATRSGDNPAQAGVADDHNEALPALADIDWIRAAGNYVEFKCGERLLIRRMTMRSAEAATRSADFVRIHRSLIVRKPLIRGFAGSGRSRVLLANGETLPVGDSYRPTVERLVPSSQDSSLRTMTV